MSVVVTCVLRLETEKLLLVTLLIENTSGGRSGLFCTLSPCKGVYLSTCSYPLPPLATPWFLTEGACVPFYLVLLGDVVAEKEEPSGRFTRSHGWVGLLGEGC